MPKTPSADTTTMLKQVAEAIAKADGADTQDDAERYLRLAQQRRASSVSRDGLRLPKSGQSALATRDKDDGNQGKLPLWRDGVIADHGVSRVTTKLADRLGGRRLLDKVRAGDQVIVRWINRLGRNYDDATVTILHLMNEGVVVKTVINAMVFEGSTTDPIQKAVRDAMIAFMATTAQHKPKKPSFSRAQNRPCGHDARPSAPLPKPRT